MASSGNSAEIQDKVKEYYGKDLQGQADLKTNVCTLGGTKMKKSVKQALALVHPEVSEK